MFYDKFAHLCKEKGVSVSRAAIDSGISKSLVTKWKANKVDAPSPEVLQKLSAYFNVTVAELLGEDKKMPSPDQFELTEREQRIIEAYRELSPERRRALAELLGVPQK